MSYQLRYRKDPASLDTQEQTETHEGNLAETQVATSSYEMVVPPQLSNVEQMALHVTGANPSQATPSASSKPEAVSVSSLDVEGPTRFDPGLGSAAVSAGAFPPADAVGPPSAVMSSRDTTYITNQPPPLYSTIDASSLSLVHDSQEVKHTNTQGTTLPPDVVVAQPTAYSFHTSVTTYSTQQSESVAEQQEWFLTDDSTSMPDLSPHYADLELSATEMASLPETVLASLLSQAAIAPQDVSTKSDEGNASYVSDSTPLGDTDIEPLRAQHKIWLPKSTEALDAYSAHTDKTVVPQTTAFTQALHHTNPHPSGVGSRIIQQPPPRYGTMSKVSQWLTTQTVTPSVTPVSTVHAISHSRGG